MRDNVGKAPGVDRWRSEELALAPDCWFEALAALWNRCIELTKLPAPWLMVRVTGIPKPDSPVLRPLSIEAVVYRAGMSCLTRGLRDWTQLWAPEQLAGAVAGRTMEELHELLSFKVDEAFHGHLDLVGIKLDLKRAFDLLRTETINDLALRLGAPPKLVALWELFDKEHLKWVEVQGSVHPDPIGCTRGVPQGDPASPLRFCLIVAAWCAFMKARLPGVSFSVYLDDRLLFVSGALGVETLLQEAVAANTLFEQHYQLGDNAAKRALFGNNAAVRARLADTFGKAAVPHVDMLGVKHSLTGPGLVLDATARVAKAIRRSHRIACTGGNTASRRLMVSSMVISLFDWVGAWQRLSKETVQTLLVGIERALLWKPFRGRNRYLMWAFHGPSVHPGFRQDWAALAHLLRFVQRRIAGRSLSGADFWRSERLRQACDSVGWKLPASGNVVSTPFGALVIGVDSVAAVRAMAERCWLLQLQRSDPKLGAGALHRREVQTAAHRQFAKIAPHFPGGPVLRLVLGLPMDGVMKARFSKTPEDRYPCMCGHVPASAAHFTFDCPLRPPFGRILEPDLPAHAWLLTQDLPLSQVRARVFDAARIRDFAGRLAGLLRPGALTRIATDGGAASGAGPCGVSSWGFAVLLNGTCETSQRLFGARQIAQLGGAIFGLDASAVFAEVWALLHALRLAAAMDLQDVLIVADNKYVVDTFTQFLSGSWPAALRVGPALWRSLLPLLRGRRVRIGWCPSHGKKPLWTPFAPFQEEAALWRALNDAADNACTAAMAPELSRCSDFDREKEEKHRWSLRALSLRHSMLSKFADHCMPPV